MSDILVLILGLIVAGVCGFCMIYAAIDMVKWGKKSMDKL